MNRTPSHVTFSCLRACDDVSHDIGSSVCARHLIHVSCACVFDLSSTSSYSLHPLDHSRPLPCGSVRSKIPCAPRRMRSLAIWPTTHLSQVLSPTSTTITTSQRPLKFSSRSPPATRGPRTCMTRRSVTTPSAEPLSSPLFTQEREEPAGRRKACHSREESFLSSQSLSVGHVSTGRPVNEFGSISSGVRENPSRDSENEQIRILLER